MQFAKDFLGSESIARTVAEFVVRAFQNANAAPSKPIRHRPVNNAYTDYTSNEETFDKRPNNDVNDGYLPMTPLRHLVKLFGLQPNQISAVAVNALVFVAQMISTFLTGPKRPGRLRHSEDSTSWILNKNSRALQDLLKTAKNESLPDTQYNNSTNKFVISYQSWIQEHDVTKFLVLYCIKRTTIVSI
ncbi:uncharacterized protein LOC113238262 isoform X2 [Hyposmocoma kahamanoa]|uniref:uncharacterized protein LOC113238262 isoform X2 n=1 Tax=Hyposmocoma kahamanoa TaxID=1477025 RepID=UPI000E6D8435|nr:uncharacterized protein LOC113238262 isoform X2 [Hyposmocoma kahamanoa]